MHSSWKIWDLLRSRPKVLNNETPAILLLNTFDPFALKILKKRIPLELFSEQKLAVKLGRELTLEWAENNFKTMSLFGNDESFFVINAQEMPEAVKSFFMETQDLILDNRYLIFDYSKNDSFYKKAQKSNLIEVLNIKAPDFWEKDKLLEFLCSEINVFLDYEAKDFFVKQVEFSLGAYYNCLAQLKINYPEQTSLSVSCVKEIMFSKNWDHFAITELFATKQYQKFYKKMSQTKDFEDIRKVAQFLQSHMLKVLSPEYTNGKSRLTKYDKEILKQNGLWSPKEISKVLKYFVDIEIKAKSRDHSVFNLLQRDYLRSQIL